MIYKEITAVITSRKTSNITYYTITPNSPWEGPQRPVTTAKKLLLGLYFPTLSEIQKTTQTESFCEVLALKVEMLERWYTHWDITIGMGPTSMDQS